VDRTRDRARVDAWQEADDWQDGDPWQASLARSRARRGRSKRRSPGLARAIPVLVLLAVGIVVIALSAGGPDDAPPVAKADAPAASPARAPATARPRPASWRDCPLAVAPAGYVNPLAQAIVNPERIDQGVDYAGVGKLVAIGSGRITHLATENTGWPGAFIEYRLLGGADAGCYVYYAEGVVPADGLQVGDSISAGQPIATIIPAYPTGIEIGWGTGISTKAYAKVAGQWSPTDDDDDIPSAAGTNFSALIAALGGPPGKNEG
jgi:hypothetical protein